MNEMRDVSSAVERIKIQEKALSNLADMLKKHEVEIAEEIRDMQA